MNQQQKDKLLARIARHEALDTIAQGSYATSAEARAT